MGNNVIKKSEKEINYQVIKKIKEHARQYNFVNDKKEFLKNVSAFEQKVILLNSQNPYEVLNYLDELDIKSSKLVLSELTRDEIKKILYNFSSNDKKCFYSKFSYLQLVNEFIVQDKNSEEYINDLTFDRKVEILNSLEQQHKEASQEVYNSLDETEKDALKYKLTDADAISALSSTTSYDADVEIKGSIENISNESVLESENVMNEQEQNKKEIEEQKNIIENKTLDQQKMEFFINNLSLYQEKYPELEKMNFEEIKTYEQIPNFLINIINVDFNLSIKKNNNEQIKTDDVEMLEKYSIIGDGKSCVSLVSNPATLEKFQDEITKQEQEMINDFTKNQYTNITQEKTNIK